MAGENVPREVICRSSLPHGARSVMGACRHTRSFNTSADGVEHEERAFPLQPGTNVRREQLGDTIAGQGSFVSVSRPRIRRSRRRGGDISTTRLIWPRASGNSCKLVFPNVLPTPNAPRIEHDTGAQLAAY